MGGAPRWALGPGRPAGNSNPNWEPSATAFGAFVRAVGTRYSGSYDPSLGRSVPGDPTISPGSAFGRSGTSPTTGRASRRRASQASSRSRTARRMYQRTSWTRPGARCRPRAMRPRATRSCSASSRHAAESFWGVFSGMTPLAFLRALYCVDSSYRELRGSAARIRGCPTTAAGSRRFRAQNPALFEASGVSDHPYMRWYPPNAELDPDPTNGSSTRDYTSLGVIGNLTRALDRLQRRVRLAHALPDLRHRVRLHHEPAQAQPRSRAPAQGDLPLPPATAAAYMNWAEYISWRNPRLRSFAQYLLLRPRASDAVQRLGRFRQRAADAGTAHQKATYYAWRLPLYLPVTDGAAQADSLEVWGCVRPGAVRRARHRGRRRQPRSSSRRDPSASSRRSRP